jgi:hypothetical protein
MLVISLIFAVCVILAAFTAEVSSKRLAKVEEELRLKVLHHANKVVQTGPEGEGGV